MESSEIGLHVFAAVWSPLFSFLSGMILAFSHYTGSSPLSSDVWKRSSTLSFAAGHTCFHTIAGRLSSPRTFHGFATHILRSTFSIVMRSIGIAGRWGRGPSFSKTSSGEGKNVASNSTACLSLSFVLDPLAPFKDGTLSNIELPLELRYFAACQMYTLSARKSSQCSFRFWMASWYSLAAPLAWRFNSGIIWPVRRWVLARFLRNLYIRRNCVRSLVHYLFTSLCW